MKILLVPLILFGVGILFWTAIRSEQLICRLLKAAPHKVGGLQQTLQTVKHLSNLKLDPAVLVLNTPMPEIIAVRSLWGMGCILISRGLISQMNEGELREILRNSLQQIASRGIVARTQRLLYAIWILRWIPEEWLTFGSSIGLPNPGLRKVMISFSPRFSTKGRIIDPKLPSPSSMFMFLMLFPFLQWVLAPLSSSRRRANWAARTPGSFNLDNALRKISRADS